MRLREPMPQISSDPQPAPTRQRLGVIDFGSNTAKMVAIELQPERSLRILDELRVSVRLSEGLEGGGALQPAPIARGLEAIRAFASFARAAGLETLLATATSAVRDASNGAEFVAAAAELGIQLRVLSGREEARVASLAVANSFQLADAAVVDVGGGSMQLSELLQRRWRAGASWPLGAVRAYERFFTGDPPKAKGIAALRQAVRDALRQALDAERLALVGRPLVAMGGGIRNLASAHQRRRSYPLGFLHGYALPTADLQGLSDELLTLNRQQRADIPGISRDRAEVIAAGALVMAEVASGLEANEVLISGQGLREGLFYPHLVPHRPDHLLDDVRSFSVLNLMRRDHDQEPHHAHVRSLALGLFDGLTPIHRLRASDRDLLAHAAWIYDIGMAGEGDRHELHALALALGRALPGFSHREQVMLALMVRFHRKGTPSLAGFEVLLNSDDGERVALLAGLLRLAEAFDRGRAQRVRHVGVVQEEGVVALVAFGGGDLSLEVGAAAARTDLLATSLGREVVVRAAP